MATFNLPKYVQDDIPACVARALAEDIGTGDITAQLIDASKYAKASVISRESGVICGRPWVDEVFRQLDPDTLIEWHIEEGDKVMQIRHCSLSLEGLKYYSRENAVR